MVAFEECIQSIKEGSVVSFKEYTLDRHEQKHLSLSIEGAVVQRVFQANENLNRDTLVEYYGEDLSDTDYLQLSCMNCPRVALGLGLDEDGQLKIKVVILNKDFYTMGSQEITVINESQIAEEPNYFKAQKGW